MATNNLPELVIVRTFDAPVEMVWKAWTEPEQAMRWWGPENFTSPACKIDLRVGGKILSCMRDPEGKDYWSVSEYLEIIPFKKLVMTDNFADFEGNIIPASAYGFTSDFPENLYVTITFEDLSGKTRMTLTHSGFSEGELKRDTYLGWSSSFDKLDNSLLADGNNKDKLLITAEPGCHEIIYKRVFDAPRELVYKIYTDPALIPQWWGPRYLTTVVEKMDVKPGGSWRYIQKDPQSVEYAFHGVYHLIEPSAKIVNTFEYEGVPGHVSLETVKFSELDGKTVLTGQSVFQSVDDRDGMIGADMELGMTQSMDRIAEILAVSKK